MGIVAAPLLLFSSQTRTPYQPNQIAQAKIEIKSKEAKARAAMAGGKSKKKKWSKGKVREKLANMVMFDAKTYDRLVAEVPKMKLITTALVSERLKCTGSLARAAMKDLAAKKLINCVSKHSKVAIYTRASE